MSAPEIKNQIVHVYDDIEEEDNHLPNWWLGILYGSIAFALGYWFIFEVTHAAPNPVASYRTEMDLLARQRASAGPISDDSLAVLAKDPATVGEGKKIFQSTCAPCHGAEGQGVVGPNLTDAFWLHGGQPTAIHKSITEGYPDKGMRAWGPMLGPLRVRSLAAFVLTIKNRNLPGKPPQGTRAD